MTWWCRPNRTGCPTAESPPPTNPGSRIAGGLGSGRWREQDELVTWFGDWELLSPGFVSLLDWRPPTDEPVEHDEVYKTFYGGVARKP